MAETGSATDMGLGLSLAFGVLGLVGALVMYLAAADQVVAAGGFALAVTAGSLAVVAIHVYKEK